MDEETLWRSRILEERANELIEYKMTASEQVESQIERVKGTLERQLRANQAYREHIKSLDQEIKQLKEIINSFGNNEEEM
ncbi:hypothetical protein TVAG_212560 [Trichomonas vaginalis G3]|uniref:Uncharacterized protein n=1 Tax=Trichomonas vaginalis (strain ATCC PRA-98 / G3) TaxID=412133 RepID=A2E2P6_TRIV3|nr:hypothetical protein TVAGG3_0166350 [Trichomonas vaginalis G3]EAY13074.1 hypothetical protein TVAG_212560 [Trichomonas vaginalis G3]KAI5548262.1 hypothetical protein TVAGG3_0166350 [Trichomonas vaginalis G3]|eukprot:XP_001325297.1 hypothetical protein [Trichomonas vaginalis G3]